MIQENKAINVNKPLCKNYKNKSFALMVCEFLPVNFKLLMRINTCVDKRHILHAEQMTPKLNKLNLDSFTVQ